MLSTILSLLHQLTEEESPTNLKTSSSAIDFSNFLKDLEAEKTTEISTSDVSEADVNEEEDLEKKKEKPTFENIWASPEGSNAKGQRIRKFPKLKVKSSTKIYRDESTDAVRMSELTTPTTSVSENSLPPNKSEVDLVGLWETAVAAETTAESTASPSFESLWGGNQTGGNRVRKFASPQRQRTVIPTSKALLPVVHRNALSPPPARRPAAPDLFSHQEDEHQEEEEETEVKPPKKTFASPKRNRNRTSISVEPPTLTSPIVSNNHSYNLQFTSTFQHILSFSSFFTSNRPWKKSSIRMRLIQRMRFLHHVWLNLLLLLLVHPSKRHRPMYQQNQNSQKAHKHSKNLTILVVD